MSKVLKLNNGLTNLSVAHRNDQAQYVGSKIFPFVEVESASGKYFKFDTDNEAMRMTEDKLANSAEASEVDWSNSEDNYICQDRALRSPVAHNDEDQADFNQKEETTIILTDKFLLAHENRVKAKLDGIDASRKDTPSKKWTDSTATVAQDLETARGMVTKGANTVIIPKIVMQKIKFHPNLLESIKYTNKGVVTQEMLAALLGVDYVYVPDVEVNTAVKGKSPSLTQLWGKNVYFAYVAPRPGQRTESAGYTFSRKFSGGVNGFRVREWEEEKRGLGGSTMIQIEASTDEKIVSERCLFVLTNVIS